MNEFYNQTAEERIIWPAAADLWRALRPKQWIKNLIIFAALIFSEKFTEPAYLLLATAGAVLFSLTASSVYLINDVLDADKDRLHPHKKYRPIASGRLSRTMAMAISAVLMLASMGLSLYINVYFALALISYVIFNLLYSLWLKKVVILDVLTIAFSFVIRVVAGALIINVSFSVWLVLCTFFLTLFLAINKRREEILVNPDFTTRPVLAHYTATLFEQMTMVVLPMTLITYTFYTFNSPHSDLLVLTVPVAVYGLFRYLYLMDIKKEINDGPADDFWSDRNLQITILFWLILVLLILIYAD